MSQLLTYPGPVGVPESRDYEVRVNGQPLFVYHIKVNPQAAYDDSKFELASMAYFDFTDTVKVDITVAKPLESVVIRPLSYGINAHIEGQTISFELDQPRKLSIEVNGYEWDALLLFANAIDPNPPKEGDPGVRFYGPGVHEAGVITLQSNETLYLAGGAYVKGAINMADAHNVRVCGRGIVSGEQYPKNESPQDKFVMTHRCRNVEFDGIILYDGFSWMMRPSYTSNIIINNIKILGYRKNTDGIDPVNCSNLVISDCFIFGHDDGVTIKASLHNDMAPVRNVLVTRCIMWNHLMRSFVVGGELAADAVENIVFVDNDIIHSSPLVNTPDRRFAAISVWQADCSTVTGVRFENIRVENVHRLIRIGIVENEFSKTRRRGNVDGVLFKDITVMDDSDPVSELTGHDETHQVRNIVFDNVRIKGKVCETLEDLKLSIGYYVSDVSIQNSPVATKGGERS